MHNCDVHNAVRSSQRALSARPYVMRPACRRFPNRVGEGGSGRAGRRLSAEKGLAQTLKREAESHAAPGVASVTSVTGDES